MTPAEIMSLADESDKAFIESAEEWIARLEECAALTPEHKP